MEQAGIPGGLLDEFAGRRSSGFKSFGGLERGWDGPTSGGRAPRAGGDVGKRCLNNFLARREKWGRVAQCPPAEIKR